jgi:hypothetical protein
VDSVTDHYGNMLATAEEKGNDAFWRSLPKDDGIYHRAGVLIGKKTALLNGLERFSLEWMLSGK